MSADQKYLRNSHLAVLFSSEGWKIFEDELKELMSMVKDDMEQITTQPLLNTNDINMCIARKNALNMVSLKIQELQEDLDNPANSIAES
jgi:undecaprenyl pyrophosphate synthase